ncbi:MAG: recombinase, partial [Parcubacteria group bacterium Gr01-1014_48]
FELYATGKYSYDSLATDLNKRGLRTRAGKLLGRKSIEHVLSNTVYYGLIKTRSATCQANFPSLISKKMFDDVQEIIQQHNHYADRTRKHSYPMAGFMRCVDCGSMLCGQMQKGHLYYACSHRRDPNCKEKKYMRWEDVEAQVAVMLGRVQLPDKFKRVLDAYFQHFAKERLSQEERERKSIKQELLRVQQQIRNIVVDRSKRIIDADVFIKIQDELLKEKEMFQDRLSVLEGKSDKFVQKFNEILDFTDHADKVFQTSGMHQKRTLMKLCFEGFTVQNQKLTPIWTPVFDVLMDVQLANFDPPKVGGKGSKTLAVTKVQSCQSGGEGGIRTLDTVSDILPFQGSPFDRSGTSPNMSVIP